MNVNLLKCFYTSFSFITIDSIMSGAYDLNLTQSRWVTSSMMNINNQDEQPNALNELIAKLALVSEELVRSVVWLFSALRWRTGMEKMKKMFCFLFCFFIRQNPVTHRCRLVSVPSWGSYKPLGIVCKYWWSVSTIITVPLAMSTILGKPLGTRTVVLWNLCYRSCRSYKEKCLKGTKWGETICAILKYWQFKSEDYFSYLIMTSLKTIWIPVSGKCDIINIYNWSAKPNREKAISTKRT